MFNHSVSIVCLWFRAAGLAVVSMHLRLTCQLQNATSVWHQMGLQMNEERTTFARIPLHVVTLEALARWSSLVIQLHACG